MESLKDYPFDDVWNPREPIEKAIDVAIERVFGDIARAIKKPIKVNFYSRNRKTQTRTFGRITLPKWFKKLKKRHLSTFSKKEKGT